MGFPIAFSQRVRTAVGADPLGALFDLTSERLVRCAVILTRRRHDAEGAAQTALVLPRHRADIASLAG